MDKVKTKRKHSSSSEEESYKKKKHKHSKKKRKEKKRKKVKEKKENKLAKSHSKSGPLDARVTVPSTSAAIQESDSDGDVIGPLPEMFDCKMKAPMTKEEWEKQQSHIRRVVDEETGRERLIKGDGEILEEIVSRDRHKDINKRATKADGDSFQFRLGLKK